MRREKVFKHKSVLLQEVIEKLRPEKNRIIVDCTLGAGNHFDRFLDALGDSGLAIGFDLDKEKIESAKVKYRNRKNVLLINGSFYELKKNLNDNGIDSADIIFADLGLTLDDYLYSEKGFGYSSKSTLLDMRLDTRLKKNASDILMEYSAAQLKKMFVKNADLKNNRFLIKYILTGRKQKDSWKTDDFSDLKIYGPKRKSYLAKVFQALRIEVNNEIENLKLFLEQSIDLLKIRGKIGVISYHSLEDREVKRFFNLHSKECICPATTLKCICSHKKRINIITKKPIIPEQDEVKNNISARSAKLRIAEKIQ